MDHLLAQRLAQAHGRGAFDLPVHRLGMDHEAHVVHGHVLQHLHVAGVGVHLHHGRVGAEGLGAAALPLVDLRGLGVEVAAADDVADLVVPRVADRRQRHRP